MTLDPETPQKAGQTTLLFGFMNFIDAAPDTGDFPFDFSVSASQPASARIRLI